MKNVLHQSKRRVTPLLRNTLCGALFFCLASYVSAQPDVTVFATGLNYPRGLKFGPDGNLYVSEAGAGGTLSTASSGAVQVQPPVGPYTGGYTSRISKITPAGVSTVVADSLPSNRNAMGDVTGIEDVAFIGNTLYALSAGAGSSHGLAGTNTGVLRVNSDGTTTQIADLSTFLKTHPVAAPSAGDFEPDGVPYSMISVGGSFAVVEANHGELDMITTAGAVTRIADISATQGHFVPTAVAYDGDYYVGNLGLFPITDGGCKILKVSAATGQVTTFATGFTTILGLAFDSAHRLYVLENTTGGNMFPKPGTGRVSRIDGAGNVEVVATGLALPTAMTFGPDGNLYVSNWGFGPPNMGEIVKVNLQSPVAVAGHPAFSAGEVALSNGLYFLGLANGMLFGFYSYLSDPHFIYHSDLGYEYVVDAADGKSGVYLYDFASAGWFYTSPTFGFPYLYDFKLQSVVYYYPDPVNAGHYDTNGVRYFYLFSTGKIISM